jgi:hypothetical protein
MESLQPLDVSRYILPDVVPTLEMASHFLDYYGLDVRNLPAHEVQLLANYNQYGASATIMSLIANRVTQSETPQDY